ncbi:hypothetical protein BDW72DRAFT_209944 [Aspergillus terricola var. indicus]
MPPKRGPSSLEDTVQAAAPPKRSRGQPKKETAPPSKRQRALYLNQRTVPATRLDVYVFGTNCAGELGLGDATKKTEIPRPVLNPKLAADDVGVVHLAVGGMHSAALTHDNRILTWGVNDDGALGRDTKQNPDDVKMRNADDEDSADGESEGEDEGNFNLKEATPLPVDAAYFPAGTVFTQLAATDSATFALTADGKVYGWGTFTNENGKKQFLPDSTKERQLTPVLIPSLENVVRLAAGAQHVLALISNGTVFSWGHNEQQQLGRQRRVHNGPIHSQTPAQCALPSGIVDIGAGLYHSFAVHKSGSVYAWGSNNFGQTAIFTSAGQSDAAVQYPTKVQALKQVRSVSGGKDHSLAITTDGQCLSWGRIDNKALGVDISAVPASNIIRDEHDRPRILKVPTAIGNIQDAIGLGIGTDHSFVITKDGHAYSWGFNAMRQTGQPGDDDVARPTPLINKHVDGKRLVFADAGGQFSIVAGEH